MNHKMKKITKSWINNNSGPSNNQKNHKEYPTKLENATITALINLEISLRDFQKFKKANHEAIIIEKQDETIDMAKLIKKEVIDISDTMDLLADVVHRQD